MAATAAIGRIDTIVIAALAPPVIRPQGAVIRAARAAPRYRTIRMKGLALHQTIFTSVAPSGRSAG